MIKVLFVGNYLSKSKGTFGVSEQIAYSLSKDLFNVHLTSRRQNQALRLIEIIFNCLFRSYHKIQIDTFSGKAFLIAEVATFMAWVRGKNPILTLHGGKLPEFYQKNKKRIHRVFKQAKYIQTPSMYLQDFFVKNGFEVHYQPNPIALNNFPFSRKMVKPHTLLWVRAFTEIYNPDLAVRTLYEVRKKYPTTRLTMVGPDKGLLEQIKKLIHELNLTSCIEITGPVKNEELYTYYQTHEIFLNTTSYESFGVAVAEAASCGIPIVSTAVGELPYLYKHNENILLVNNFNEVTFSSEVIRLIESPDLAKELSINARKRVEAFDWELIKPNWIELLK